MRNLNKFQIILLLIFALGALVGIIAFSAFRSKPAPGAFRTTLVLWGTFDQRMVDDMIGDLQDELGRDVFTLTYQEKDPATYNLDLLTAIADGTSPDLFFMSNDNFIDLEDRAFIAPPESFPERAFRDTFLEAGEIFLTGGGVAALPFSVDPLVMYWNRDLFSAAGLAKPPTTWDQFFSLVGDVTLVDERRGVVRSAVALGEFGNVTNAKGILATLIMQAGGGVVARDRTTGVPRSALTERGAATIPPAESALRFYSDFSNPVKPTYSWNRSLPESRRAFTGGDLAVYFGFASEAVSLRAENPNLNFDVARMPQAKDATKQITFARIVGIAVSKHSPNIADAFSAALIFSGRSAQGLWSEYTALPPVRRDLLAEKPANPYRALFHTAALISRSWPDPDASATNIIFRDMIESTSSGRARLSEAVIRAHGELDALLTKQ